MKMPFGMFVPIRGRLVKAHRIREWNSEHLVVGGSDAMQHVAQSACVGRRELVHAADVASATDQNLKGPDSPKRHQGDEPVIFEEQAFMLALFHRNVVAKKASFVCLEVGALRGEFLRGLNGNGVRGP